MKKALDLKKTEWAYRQWCLGYTQIQIADALFVCEKTIARALKNKPRIRPILKYEETIPQSTSLTAPFTQGSQE